MNVRNSLKVAAAAAIVALSGAAHATVVDFNSLAGQGFAFLGTSFSDDGLTFTSTDENMFYWGHGSSEIADPNGTTMSENFQQTPIDVALTAGGAFTLNSVDLADVYNQGTAVDVLLTYVDGTGSHDVTLNVAAARGLQTFQLGYAGVTSFSLTGENFWYQMDNISYSTPTAVPEPGSIGMMLAGLAAIGVVARRRKA